MSTSAMENDGLCWKCQSLLNTQYPEALVTTETDETRQGPEKTQLRRVKTCESVEVTAARGCRLCLNLLHALSIPARAALHRPTGAVDGTVPTADVEYEEEIYLGDSHAPSIALRVDPDNARLGRNAGDEIKTLMQLFPEAEIAPFVSRGEVGDSTDSDTSWSVAANWLDECVKSHKSCNKLMTTKPFLPSRVIDLGSGAPRLVVVNDGAPIFPYATVSHCWGSHIPLLLLSSNIAELQKSIPTSQLSKSFQDAFLVAQRLGLTYIWIDSLCIIQDSAVDWERESQSMSEVYSNSYCNIAASHAADGTYGCFIKRDPDLVKPVKVDLNWGPNPGTYYVIQWLYWRQKVMEMPLHRRAWVCQERYLAPRNLYFGATQLYWECGERVACETFPSGLPPRVVDGPSKSLNPHADGAYRRERLGLPEAPDMDAFGLWDLIVSTYSTGKLTYSADKLVALSGLAARMQKHTGAQYLAGMWRTHLAYQLLWTVSGIQWVVSRSRPEVYTAPSWSWASIHGRIEDACIVRHADDREIALEILDVEVELVSDKNHFGQVKGGFLRLRCSLAKAGVYIEESPESRGSFDLIVNGSRIGTARLDAHGSESDPLTHHGLYYLPVRYSAGYEEVTLKGETISVPRAAGIILQPASPESQSEFVRVGVFEIYSSPDEFQSACRQYSREHTGRQDESGLWVLSRKTGDLSYLCHTQHQ
ncbi:heterokaryon incompatibility protein [Phlyctema vagabunda]|uniref:Heterokaryon incompatibility protein n=1 Tax=Phlyctema vagabunda TaxID=108571 RepID=A0ABR4PJI0_9HELO